MLRAVFAISQRGKMSKALISLKTMDLSGVGQGHPRVLHSFSRPRLVRFASNDDKIKGATGGNQGGIIGNISSTSIGGVAGNEPTASAQAQVQPEAYGNDAMGNKNASKHECGKIGTDESVQCRQKMDIKPKGSPKSESNFSEDAVKQLQDAAANLPSKEQVEKYFFRVVAFIYDITYLTANWTMRFVDQKILQNDTFKYYWKRFHEKMEQAKKD